jgi:hypothetical protein
MGSCKSILVLEDEKEKYPIPGKMVNFINIEWI